MIGRWAISLNCGFKEPTILIEQSLTGLSLSHLLSILHMLNPADIIRQKDLRDFDEAKLLNSDDGPEVSHSP